MRKQEIKAIKRQKFRKLFPSCLFQLLFKLHEANIWREFYYRKYSIKIYWSI